MSEINNFDPTPNKGPFGNDGTINNPYQQPRGEKPKNYLVESILITLFCCLPLGIVGIVYAAQVNSKYDSGDYNGAVEASKNAGKFVKYGLIAGIVVAILYAVLAFFGVMATSMN